VGVLRAVRRREAQGPNPQNEGEASEPVKRREVSLPLCGIEVREEPSVAVCMRRAGKGSQRSPARECTCGEASPRNERSGVIGFGETENPGTIAIVDVGYFHADLLFGTEMHHCIIRPRNHPLCARNFVASGKHGNRIFEVLVRQLSDYATGS
jgi:hypothetical protein